MGLALFVVVGAIVSLLVGRLRESLLSTARAEAGLRKASEQRRLALEAAELGAWDYRFESADMSLDERCRSRFGVTTDMRYDDAIARIHPDDRAAVEEAMKHAIAGANGGAYEREFRVVWPDNSEHWVASHGRVFFEGEGDRRGAVRFVGVSTEITERKHAEERLRQAQKLESIGLLAGGIAHDFNNLLTVIMGSACSALEERPSCQYSQAILSASTRAAYLTKQLLAYAGKGAVIVKLIDLTELVSQSTRLHSVSVPKGVNISYNLSKELPCIEADPSRIEQILMNLVVNAGESIPDGSNGLIDIATSSCEVTSEFARRTPRRTTSPPVPMSAWRCGITAWAWTNPRYRVFSIRSSLPSLPAAGSAWPLSTESYAVAMALLTSIVCPALAPHFVCSCQPPQRNGQQISPSPPRTSKGGGTQAGVHDSEAAQT